MKEIPQKYQKWHKLAFENEELLKNINKCACFYCGNRFSVYKISEWIEDKRALTALCPKCGIDSVIPAVIDNQEISDIELEEMHNYWF